MFRNLMSILLIAGATSMLAAPSGAERAGARGARNADQKAAQAQALAQPPQQTPEQQQEPFWVPPEGLDEPIDPDTYIVGPSDVFVLALRGQSQREFRLQVLPEGTILLPNYGAFRVAGSTISELRERLRTALGKYYRNVEFDLELVVPRSFVVYVLGEVQKPGAVTLNAPFRVSTAIAAAGGIKKNGSLRYVEVVEDGRRVRLVDLFSFLKLGRVEENPTLKESQSVFVPARKASARIYGEVWNPAVYEVRPGDTVSDVIEFAGGPRNYADLDRVILERHEPNGRAHVQSVAAAELDTVGVHDRDVVVVPDARTFGRGDYVLVRGGGGREGKVFIEKGETIGEFAPRLYRLREDHDISRAVIEREKDDGGVEYIKVDLERIIAGEESGDIPLESGDIISIPEAENYVYVAGEVVSPGEIEFQRGMPAERYIAMAGGPTRNGSMNKITIFGKDGSSREGDRNSTVFRGDTILLERTFKSYVGPLFVGFTSLTSLILSVIAVSR